MTTLKIGSKGEEVKLLQKSLGLIADGIFGTKTADAVKAFQKKKGLTADGIVGSKTWEALGLKKENKAIADFVIYSPLSNHITPIAAKKNLYIVVHFTAGASSKAGSALKTKTVFTTRLASADFVIDDDTILQLNPDLSKYGTWHCGDKKNPYTNGGTLYGKCTNRNSIGIEVCSNLKAGYSASNVNHEGWYYTDKELDNLVKLIKVLMLKYNIPVSNVVRHYDVSGKVCPGIIGYNDYYICDKNGNKTSQKSTQEKWINLKKKL